MFDSRCLDETANEAVAAILSRLLLGPGAVLPEGGHFPIVPTTIQGSHSCGPHRNLGRSILYIHDKCSQHPNINRY